MLLNHGQQSNLNGEFMKEIRFHGRGGQGVVIASRILALAAFKEGKYSQSFPFFGGERRGAPVEAYARLSTSPIEIRSKIKNPDYVIILDPHALKFSRPFEGLKSGGMAILNYPKTKRKFSVGDTFCHCDISIFTVDATQISIEVFGEQSFPITNVAMLGAFASATSEVSLSTVVEVLNYFFSGKSLIKNKRGALIAAQRLSEIKL